MIAGKKQRRRDPEASLTPDQILDVLAKFNYSCFACGSHEDPCIDHHKPLNSGFALSPKNAVVLCKRCNSQKRDRMPQNFYTTEQLLELEADYGVASD